jgi:hypothetical protein
MNLAVFDIDPSRIPADCPIYTYRKWRSLPNEQKEGMLETLQELSDSSTVYEVKGGTKIRKSDFMLPKSAKAIFRTVFLLQIVLGHLLKKGS